MPGLCKRLSCIYTSHHWHILAKANQMEYINDRVFENERFAEKEIKKAEYEFCRFKNCDFSESDLSEIRFLDTAFINCNLSNAKLYKTSFQEVRMVNCKMLGLPFDTCSDFNFSIDFDTCILNHSVFYQTPLGNTKFNNCQLRDVDFSEANLKTTVLFNCDLSGATFDRTNLEKADLRKSINYSLDPETNILNGARFSVPEVLRLLDKYNLEIEMA